MSSIPTIGSGIIHWGSDFTGIYDSVVFGATNLVAGEGIGNGLGFASVNEGAFASTVDETGGVLSITTDTADNDNAVLLAGTFSPRDGKMVAKARFKYDSLNVGVFVGFSETMALDTPVMPAEFATTTMTYNGTGGMIGLQMDLDGTTDDFRAVMGDAGGAISDSSAGIRATATLTVDRWFEAEVILNEDGSGECWLGHSGNANSLNFNNKSLVKRFSTGTLLTNTDLFYAVLMIENRTGANNILEVDYFAGEAGRDWRF